MMSHQIISKKNCPLRVLKRFPPRDDPRAEWPEVHGREDKRRFCNGETFIIERVSGREGRRDRSIEQLDFGFIHSLRGRIHD